MWIVEGENKLRLNGSDIPATTIDVKGNSVTYTYGSFYSKFQADNFPSDIKDVRLLRHTVTCEENVLNLEWVSRRDGSIKKVFFVKKQ
jgi:hypothetical protein